MGTAPAALHAAEGRFAHLSGSLKGLSQSEVPAQYIYERGGSSSKEKGGRETAMRRIGTHRIVTVDSAVVETNALSVSAVDTCLAIL